MAASVDTPSSAYLNQEVIGVMGFSPLFSPSSDKRFWSTLHSRIGTLLDERKGEKDVPSSDPSAATFKNDRAKQLKNDSMLLIRGFDSISHTLSQLSNSLDNALQGARDLANPPTLTQIFQSTLNNPGSREEDAIKKQEEESKTGSKRMYDHSHCLEDPADDSEKKNDQGLKDKNLKKAKNLAVSMATKAATLARELKNIKLDLCFMQEQCALLEEENRRLRDGFTQGVRPEEDDLVRLQLEALLAEKSRLANDNANLIRENQCLHQLVEYHQLTSQDLSASYEQVIQGMCLDFSSPPPPAANSACASDNDDDDAESKALQTPQIDLYGFCTILDN
ncbi:Heat-inducible transcription repressor [Quillaja saponaria]|uniref:Heat-inducible transcription repressor n=1 Tax=Quillaja saponaria TaxID=32244 RepID=A0AAD7VIQ7_QUISA|nr:Heat-inducible transcription repressor [Quillaja saponaria]